MISIIQNYIQATHNHQILQDNLNSLTQWASDWSMDFNISKCKILQITTHHIKSIFTYKVSNIPLATVQLSWHSFASQAIVGSSCELQANWLLEFLKRNLYNAPVEIYIQTAGPTINRILLCHLGPIPSY